MPRVLLPFRRALTLAWVLAFLFALPLSASAQSSTPNLAEMFTNFSESSVALMTLAKGVAFLLGLCITGVGLFKLKQFSEAGGRIGIQQPLIILFVGTCLIALPGMIDMTTETMSLGASTGTELLSEPNVGGGVPGMDGAIKGVLLFVKLVGHLAFIRGFLILKDVGEQKQGASIGRALTHILGGAAAININATIAMLGATFAPGMDLGGLGGG
jgi:intracellular multiplication protein IcmC